MKIKIIKENKSIPAPLEFDLPVFTVLTGENGSGKTHLFEAISNNQMGQVFVDGQRLQNLKFLRFNELNPQIDQSCDPMTIAQRVKELSQQLFRRGQRPNVPANTAIENDPTLHNLHDQRQREAIIKICKKESILPSSLSEDILTDNITMLDFSGNNIFSGQFAWLFKNYHIKILDNDLIPIQEARGVEGLPKHLSDEQFKAKYGEAPWEFVNTILERLSLPYLVNNPMANKRDSTFEFRLIHKEKIDLTIDTNALSTGEKTLMSLALAIYNTTNEGDKADMLILDEPDAPLHPSMSKLMLDILEEDIAKKHNIPVIISTHSPTTVACAPAYSLYKITKEDKEPKQCDLEDSMRILSYGIPNLRLSTEARRQVFVEFDYDVKYYEAMFNILNRSYPEEFETTPQFLPPHSKNGCNCADVLEITKKMRDMGNPQVYGLIDWDTTNRPEEQIVVLGNQKRYAIENYVFEPHILGLYLIEKGFVDSSEMGLTGCNSFLDVSDLVRKDPAQLQTIATAVEGKISWNDSENTDTFDSELVDGTTLKIRKELQTIQGHEFEEKCKSTWPKLRSVRSNNGGDSELKLDIINRIVNTFPGLLSKDILDTFKEFK